MNATEAKVEEALQKLDHDDAAKADNQEEKKQPEVSEEDGGDASQDSPDTADNGDGDEAKKTESEDEEEGKFTADDALEIEEAKEPDAPEVDSTGIRLSSVEQKYIADNVQPLTIRGMVGDKATEIKVYAPDQIPADFTFNSQADLLSAQTAFVRMENKAEQLLGGLRNQQSQAQAKDFENRENEGIRQDVAELQKDGAFPKFKLQPGSKDFENDPAAGQMSEILSVMTKANEQYIKEYNQGRPYKHIGFKEAHAIWEKGQPAKKQAAAQKKEDVDRKDVADKIGNNRGLTSNKLQKPRVSRGMTTDSIINRYESEEWS